MFRSSFQGYTQKLLSVLKDSGECKDEFCNKLLKSIHIQGLSNFYLNAKEVL